ncbi:MAG TPA: DUF72 domain-containing protein [Pyrinomonadaceae bacterium]|nr:DUF72 domain-containing protein [Pyrinomonadaceae bacterium]
MSGGEVQIGTCGFRVSRAEYVRTLPSVEIQQTFYQPPLVPTLERWRADSPADFEYALKAWMLITHEARSPTYRRLKRKLTEEEAEGVGSFKWTSVVREAWDVTLACARALRSRVVLFQCPASFTPTDVNLKRLRKFFSEIERGGLELAWEPRGVEWGADLVRGLCRELRLRHAVDPFAGRTTTPSESYFRLHGRKGWRYRYEDGELEELASMLRDDARSYVFFNNIHMTEDALRFREIVRDSRL